MILKKRIASTTDVSSRSWTTRWTTSIAGWWKFLRKATLTPSASIPTPRQHVIAKEMFAATAVRRQRGSVSRSLAAITLAFALLADGFGGSAALAQSKKKKKIKK